MQENKHLGDSTAFAIGLPADSLGLWIGICLPADLSIGTIYDSINNRDAN